MSGAQSPEKQPPIPKSIEERIERDGYTFVRAERDPYDLRGTEWAQYGQCGRIIYYAVANGRGAMSWRILLGEYVNDAPAEPTADALCWHYVPIFRPDFLDDTDATDCDLVPGGACCSDMGYMAGEPGLAHYREGGDEAVFEWLRSLCNEEFPDD